MKPFALVQILPFSGALFMLYCYIFPCSLPSWYTFDSLYDEEMVKRIAKQK